MGDPKKPKKKYRTPSHPWRAERLAVEKTVKKDYGFVNKKEIWKMESVLNGFKSQAKKLTKAKTDQSKKEQELFINKLSKYGFVNKDAKLEQVLGLELRNVLDKRLQSVVYRKNIAGTMKQARQLIIHGHVLVGNKKISGPSYLVSVEEEPLVMLSPKSKFSLEVNSKQVKK